MPNSASLSPAHGLDGDQLLARDLRALRKARGLTLAEIGARLSRSVGWLSQVERGLSIPSLGDLRAFAELFGVPVSLFFGHDGRGQRARRRGARRPGGARLAPANPGWWRNLLSPDLGGSFEMLRSEFAPGAALAETALRQTEEAGYVASGRFDIEIDGVWHHLAEGDSFRFAAKPFRWKNPACRAGGRHLGRVATCLLELPAGRQDWEKKWLEFLRRRGSSSSAAARSASRRSTIWPRPAGPTACCWKRTS